MRQKLQASRSSGTRGSQSNLLGIGREHPSIDGEGIAGAGGLTSYTSGTTAVLESELRRVQHLVGDMQRQRQELSQAVRQLTENTQSLGGRPQGSASASIAATVAHSGSSVTLAAMEQSAAAATEADALAGDGKKRTNSTSGWTETDLDAMYGIDHGSAFDTSMDNISMAGQINHAHQAQSTLPLFIDTDDLSQRLEQRKRATASTAYMNELDHLQHVIGGDLNAAGADEDDDELHGGGAFAGLAGQLADKPEPKTVRIVKRESERRHRERGGGHVGAGGGSANNLEHVEEEELQLQQMQLHQHQQLQQQQHLTMDDYSRSKSLPRSYLDTDALYTQPESRAKRLSAASSTAAIPMNYSNYFAMDQQQQRLSAYPVSLGPVDSYVPQSSRSHHLSSQSKSLTESLAASNNPFHMYLAEDHQKIMQHQNAQQHQQQHRHMYGAAAPGGGSDGSSSGLRQKTESVQSLSKAMGSLSPVYQSEAARQIICEMAGSSADTAHAPSQSSGAATQLVGKAKRSNRTSQDKRRYMTAPSNTMNAKSMQNILQTENDMNKNVRNC